MRLFSTVLLAAALVVPLQAEAADGGAWWSGDWFVKIGAAGFVAPRYEGSNSYLLQGQPLFSVGKAGDKIRFASRNDNPSFALYDEGPYRAGIVGKLVMPRDGSDSDDLKGLDKVRLGLELGGFIEAYPTDFIRVRAEVRQGIRSHDGIVADISADAFKDLTPAIRLSAGPRLSLASNGYMDAYYEVGATESAKSGLKRYDPSGGLQSAGVGGAITWQATDQIAASAFTEYKRLLGDVADSSLVRERGDKNQFLFGISTTYTFGVAVP